FHERVVDRIEELERRDDARRLGGIEPRGGQRHVESPGELTLRGRRRRWRGEHGEQQDDREGEPATRRSVHVDTSCVSERWSGAERNANRAGSGGIIGDRRRLS